MKNYDFLKKKNIAFIITAAILLVGVVSFIISGFNMGVDFTGGSKITLQMDKTPTDNLDDIEQHVKDIVGEDKFVSLIQSTSNAKTVIVTIKSVTAFDTLVINELASLYNVSADVIGDKTNTTDDDESYSYFSFKVADGTKVDDASVKEKLNALDKYNDVFKSVKTDDGTVTVSYYSTSFEQQIINKINADENLEVVHNDISTISKNRASAQTKTALIAALVAILLMLVYITFRFKQVASGLSSVACLFFNLFVMFLFYSIFRWEMTLDIIPACLTILGYSINATIVIFDRIRENYGKMPEFDEAANGGVHSTMLRSINTTFTTLVTILLVYILGVESIKAFALPLIIGIIAGLFSSVFLAAPIWSVLRKWFKVEEKEAAKKEAK
ncbi:MAG: protein translocase subunit SecF [Clostridia bacterium]|nr:protein translocase subunit SecF [Clostridia bacterium]